MKKKVKKRASRGEGKRFLIPGEETTRPEKEGLYEECFRKLDVALPSSGIGRGAYRRLMRELMRLSEIEDQMVSLRLYGLDVEGFIERGRARVLSSKKSKSSWESWTPFDDDEIEC
jgi:hypothetical protein